jgi:hypothetical protein
VAKEESDLKVMSVKESLTLNHIQQELQRSFTTNHIGQKLGNNTQTTPNQALGTGAQSQSQTQGNGTPIQQGGVTGQKKG